MSGQLNPNVFVKLCATCHGYHDTRVACLVRDGASAPSAHYSCGRCPSGTHSADMSLYEAMKHAALVHDKPVRRPIHMLAVRAR